MAQYPSLAALRGALTADDPDTRGEAYGAVYEQDLKPSAVLEADPSEETVTALVDGEVIGEDSTDEYRTAAAANERVIELLEAIASNTGGEA